MVIKYLETKTPINKINSSDQDQMVRITVQSIHLGLLSDIGCQIVVCGPPASPSPENS
jgi:hypothetical protein